MKKRKKHSLPINRNFVIVLNKSLKKNNIVGLCSLTPLSKEMHIYCEYSILERFIITQPQTNKTPANKVQKTICGIDVKDDAGIFEGKKDKQYVLQFFAFRKM